VDAEAGLGFFIGHVPQSALTDAASLDAKAHLKNNHFQLSTQQ
jgi:hypothetical protein